MVITDFFVSIISSAAVSAALCGLLLWVTKAWVSERLKNAIKAEYDVKLETHKAQTKADYDQKLEAYKTQLKSQADVEIEKLKSSLSVIAAEQNTKFGKLHERRVQVIADTYARLITLHTCLANYVKPFEIAGGPSREERRNSMVAAFEEFRPYFSQNRIFLPKTVAEVIQKIEMEMVQAGNLFTFTVDLPATPDVNQWVKITEQVNNEIGVALTGLEEAMRSALGDKG
jgi:SHS2 domain-containing protein